jgi:nitrogen-specific signal transduction histidine kinase/CheY-like chemotaxis protein
MRDITERLQIEQKLRDSQKIESLGLLAGGLAHDFNNLLTTILGYASLSDGELPRESPVRVYLSEIEQASRRASELCHQLLAYAGRGRVVVGPINLSTLVDESIRLLRLSISTKAVLNLQLEPHLPFINGDASQLRQVVMNLLMNASDALNGREGAIDIRTGIRNFTAQELKLKLFGDQLPAGEYLFLEVADTGSGMTPEVKAKLFDPFFTTKSKGRGLGMAAVLGIVKVHHGAIRVESEIGQGSQLQLLFPAFAGTVLQESRAASRMLRGHGLVLVVDDEEIVRKLAVRMARSLGFETVEARDGQEAVEWVSERGDSLRAILLDMTMPRLNGREAYLAIRQRYPSLPILVMSGFSASEVTTNFINSRYVGFLQKPFSQQDLSNGLQSLLVSET